MYEKETFKERFEMYLETCKSEEGRRIIFSGVIRDYINGRINLRRLKLAIRRLEKIEKSKLYLYYWVLLLTLFDY